MPYGIHRFLWNFSVSRPFINQYVTRVRNALEREGEFSDMLPRPPSQVLGIGKMRYEVFVPRGKLAQ